MKKLLALVLAFSAIFTLTACESSTTQQNGSASSLQLTDEQEVSNIEETHNNTDTTEPEMDNDDIDDNVNSLIVYFSWSGNTEAVAGEIQNQTGADIFELVPQEPYTDDYDELLDIAQEEQRNNARPVISESIENLDDYQTVYIGFPNWWGDMPMILYSFLDDYDLSGKTIVPFCTSGGSGFSNTIGTIESMEPDAEVLEGLSLGSADAADSGETVGQWLSSLGLAE